jgi:hypothetical protein
MNTQLQERRASTARGAGVTASARRSGRLNRRVADVLAPRLLVIIRRCLDPSRAA